MLCAMTTACWLLRRGEHPLHPQDLLRHLLEHEADQLFEQVFQQHHGERQAQPCWKMLCVWDTWS